VRQLEGHRAVGGDHARREQYDIRPTRPVDIRRIEGGIFNWGADNPCENNPYEMGLDRLDLDVDCVARDALLRIAEQGVTRRIVGVEMDGERLELASVIPKHVRPPRPRAATTCAYRSERFVSGVWSDSSRARVYWMVRAMSASRMCSFGACTRQPP
jgi:hypothetical protein